MADNWDELAEVLQAETTVYRRVLDIVLQERAELQRSRRAEVEAVAAAKRELIEKLQSLEGQRTEVIHRLASASELPAGRMKLRLLILSAPESKASRLQRCRDELVELVAQVKAENQRNETLYRHACDLVRAALGVVKGLAANGCVYQRGGRMQTARLHGKLICDEI
jgi:flagellar biosynthesis/type III secretory pathway chaperone